MGRPPSRICKRGHDKDAVGRDTNGGCLECRRIRKEEAAGPPLPTFDEVMRDVAEMRARVRARSSRAA